MPLETAKHRKRKAECLSVIEAVSALCLMEILGIFDLDEEELGVCLGFAAVAFESMASLPRNFEPIDPFQQKMICSLKGLFGLQSKKFPFGSVSSFATAYICA